MKYRTLILANYFMITRVPFAGSNNLGDLYIIQLIGAEKKSWGNAAESLVMVVSAVKYKKLAL